MKRFLLLLCAFAGALLFSGCQSEGYKTIDGVIVFDTPAREPGQKSVLGLKTPPMETVRVGFIGLGMRGPGAVERFTHLHGVDIKALCDLYPERVDSAQAILARRGCPAAEAYSGEEGWKQLCERDDIDLVYIVTPWQKHVPMAVYAMEHGKHVAVEVPAATSLDECWQLVNTAEKTQRHCMMLENCVYDFCELTTKDRISTIWRLSGTITRVTGVSTSTRSTAATSMPRTASAPPVRCSTSTAATR